MDGTAYHNGPETRRYGTFRLRALRPGERDSSPLLIGRDRLNMYMWQSMDREAIHALPHIHFLLFYQPFFAEPGQRFAGGLRSCDTHGDIMHCLYDRLQIRLEPVMVLTEIVQ